MKKIGNLFDIKISNHNPRAEWQEAFKRMAEIGDDMLLDSNDIKSSFDEEEWKW